MLKLAERGRSVSRSSRGSPARAPSQSSESAPGRRPSVASAPALVPLGDLEAAREPWQRLSEADGNVFRTWEWASTWWRHLGRDRPLHVTGCRDADGSLLGILPLYDAQRLPLRVMRFIGHGPADQLGPVGASQDRPALATALTRAVQRRRSLLLAERLPGSEGWSERLGAEVIRRESSPRLEVPEGGWEAFLASRSSNFRQQVRRRERILIREHGLGYRLTDSRSLEADLDSLFRLHESRWDGPGTTSFSRLRAFHTDFAALALDRGWLRLWLAEISGRPVAAWYGFRFGGAEWYYQAGRDPRWEREAVGFVLLAHTVRSAMEDGAAEYKLLLGGESYKARFSSDDPGLDTVVTGTGAAAGLATLGLKAAVRTSPKARGRLVAVARRLGIER